MSRSMAGTGFTRLVPNALTICKGLSLLYRKPEQSRSCSFQQFPHAPDVIRYSRCHRGSDPQRLMTAAEIVVGIPENDRRPVIFPLLAERICKPCESAVSHAKGEVRALHYRSADTFRIRISADWDYLHGSDFGGRIPRFAFARGFVDFYQHGVIDAISEGVGDGGFVRPKSVCGHLELAAGMNRVPQAFNKNIGNGLVSFAHRDVENQLGSSFDGDECIAITEVLVIFRENALLFFPKDLKNFVGLTIFHDHAFDPRRHDPLALLTGEHQELQNRGVVNIGGSLHARHTVAFEEETENHLGFVHRQIHTI